MKRKNNTPPPKFLEELPEEVRNQINDVYAMYDNASLPYRTSEPENLPTFPNQISSLTGDDVANMQGSYTAWYAYANDKLKFIKVALTICEVNLDNIFRIQLSQVEGKTLEEKKSVVAGGETYQAVFKVKTKLKAYSDMLAAEVDTLEKQIMTLRNELRRREL